MATGGGLQDAFKAFASKGGGTEQTTADFTKWCKDANVFGKTCNSNHVDIAFAKVKPKTSKTITFNELNALIAEMAKNYKVDHKLDDAKANEEIKDKLSKATPKAHGTTKISTTGGVAKMTDTSKYTGAHKERFDAEGKGKGAEGRSDKVEASGYVGNYKGEGTYDKK
jgi:hypothetical protein